MSLVHRKGRQSGRAALLRGVLDDVEDLQRDLGRGKAANNAHRASELVRLFQICQYCSLEEAVVAILGSGGPFVAGLEFSRGAGVRDIPLQPAVVLAWVDRFLRPDAARELRDAAAKVTRRLRDVRARTMKAVKTAALRWEMPNSRGEFGTVFEPRESLRDGSLEVCVRSDMPLTTATFSALVLHDDASLNLDEGSLLLCLVRAYAGALADADPQAGSPHDTPGTKITPGGLASLLIEAENMCLPPSMPSMARSLPAYHKRRTVLFNRHVRPLLGTPRGDSVFLPERVVAAWLPGVGPLPTWAQKTSWGGVPEGGGSSGAGKRSSLPTEIDGVDALVQF
ncbi:unnamed protein product [Pedinophyceae sp. YPF-701]|nr:unnamed protein product [Pedinophyceae sp. YPF-701]